MSKYCICVNSIMEYKANYKYQFTLYDDGPLGDDYFVYFHTGPDLDNFDNEGYFFTEKKFNQYFMMIQYYRESKINQILS